jgi:hypothetical protein
MKLVLRRDQRSSTFGKVIFQLGVRADISPDERKAIERYRLGDTMLYQKNEIVDPGKGLLGLASRVAFKAMNVTVSVGDLVSGKQIECKDVVEMIAVEEQIKEAAATFKQVLNAATHFGGEEVIQL